MEANITPLLSKGERWITNGGVAHGLRLPMCACPINLHRMIAQHLLR